MEKHLEVANLYIATLKAMSLVFQHSHWTTKGPPFYGDHLLFERLYNDALKLLDMAAEKYIGVFGDQSLDYDLQTKLLAGILSKFSKLEGSPIPMCLAVVKSFLGLSEQASKLFEDDSLMTLGLADMLGAISDKCEEFAYLLQQTQDGKSK
jgi:DNA-binding ferritin-like protein